MFQLVARLSGIPKTLTFEELLGCLRCNAPGVRSKAEAILQRDVGGPNLVYVVATCTSRRCGQPYFAIYKNRGLDSSRFTCCDTMPSSPPFQERDRTIQKISPNYHEIVEQASSAEHHGLTLIAGAGYRKALEYLVKDYVVRGLRAQLSAEVNAEQPQNVRNIESEIATILDQPLGQIIALIPSDDLRAVAKRAAWLGNDETHYTRKWEREDLQSLKDVLSLLTSHIVSTETVAALLKRMPEN